MLVNGGRRSIASALLHHVKNKVGPVCSCPTINRHSSSHPSSSNPPPSPPSSLLQHLKQRIQISGPITVASYMRECLSNPSFGYYMKRDVFGAGGDFVTSPEVSQMFGEIIAVWVYVQWKQMGAPPNVQLVELGPGRGTMMADILRVSQQPAFKQFFDSLTIRMVEVSETMTQLQRGNLKTTHCKTTGKHILPNSSVEVSWHANIKDIPSGQPSIYLAHEFFDALPVHLFQRRNGTGAWRELLVNYSNTKQKLELVMAPGGSPTATSFLQRDLNSGDKCEVCPDAALIMSHMTRKISQYGGCALIIDYGGEGSDYHSIRGFKEHSLVEDIFLSPGDCDLTANVDFSFLKRSSHEGVVCHGPITQRSFLLQMGLVERLKVLIQKTPKEDLAGLMSSYQFLTSKESMGEKFKVMAVTHPAMGTPITFGGTYD